MVYAPFVLTESFVSPYTPAKRTSFCLRPARTAENGLEVPKKPSLSTCAAIGKPETEEMLSLSRGIFQFRLSE